MKTRIFFSSLFAIGSIAIFSACETEDIEGESHAEIASDTPENTAISDVCSCALVVSEIVSSDYVAHANELVRVDMLGKFAPDIVTISLPISNVSNRGMPIEVATMNQGGAEDGSILRIAADQQKIYPTIHSTLDMKDREVMVRLTSTGDGWIVVSIR